MVLIFQKPSFSLIYFSLFPMYPLSLSLSISFFVYIRILCPSHYLPLSPFISFRFSLCPVSSYIDLSLSLSLSLILSLGDLSRKVRLQELGFPTSFSSPSLDLARHIYYLYQQPATSSTAAIEEPRSTFLTDHRWDGEGLHRCGLRRVDCGLSFHYWILYFSFWQPSDLEEQQTRQSVPVKW